MIVLASAIFAMALIVAIVLIVRSGRDEKRRRLIYPSGCRGRSI